MILVPIFEWRPEWPVDTIKSRAVGLIFQIIKEWAAIRIYTISGTSRPEFRLHFWEKGNLRKCYVVRNIDIRYTGLTSFGCNDHSSIGCLGTIECSRT